MIKLLSKPISINSLGTKRASQVSQGRRIDALPATGWAVADTYALLTDLDKTSALCKVVGKEKSVRVAFIVTNDDRRFQAVTRRLPNGVEPVRLYESYLTNFRFASGE